MVEQFILLVEYSEKEPEPAHHSGASPEKAATATAEKPATAKDSGATTFKAYGAFETPDKATEWAHSHDLGANVKNYTAVTLYTPVN